MTNSAGIVLQRSEYEPYGYLLNRPMEDGPGYTGHVTDAATGLVYMQQRYYDPLIGQRFLSVDPVTAYSPGGAFNQYWYANANPYRMVDPDGRLPNEVYLISGGGGSSTQGITTQKKAPVPANCYETHTCTPEQVEEAMREEPAKVLGLIGSPLEILADFLNGNYKKAVLTAALNAIPGGTEASVGRRVIGATGKFGEMALRNLVGGEGAFFRTSQGARFIDAFAGGVAYESKVGRTSATAFVRSQIAKDVELIQSGAISASEWHFYRSPVTGHIGPTWPLEKLLRESGIGIVLEVP